MAPMLASAIRLSGDERSAGALHNADGDADAGLRTTLIADDHVAQIRPIADGDADGRRLSRSHCR